MLDKKQVKVVNENTLVPLSILGIIITAMILGVIHVQSIASDTRAVTIMSVSNQSEISSLRDEDKEIKKEFVKSISEISDRLARMEGALGMKVYKK